MKNRFIYFFGFLAWGVLHCGTQTQAQPGQLAIGQLHIEKSTNNLILHLEAFKLVASEKLFSKEPYSIQEEGSIIGIITDQSGKPIDTLWVGSPLKQRLEYPTGLGGELATLTQENSHADILLRFQYKPNMKRIRFQQLQANKVYTNLTILPIQLR